MQPVVIAPLFVPHGVSARLYYGLEVVEGLRQLAGSSVHCVATSPPYWGLRDYGGQPDQLGLEETPASYVDRLVAVFEEVKRVLRPDGVLWLNLGDSYHNVRTHKQGGQPKQGFHNDRHGQPETGGRNRAQRLEGLKEKDLVGIPWRVALALQEAGWYLRSDIIWSKPNPMPESVRDRCTRSHEYVFMFAHPDSGGRYFYDSAAIMEPFVEDRQVQGGGRNKRTVWSVSPHSYRGAHFATWPPELVETMIKAGTSEHGACSMCGAPTVPHIERVWAQPTRQSYKRDSAEDSHWRGLQPTGRIGGFVGGTSNITGWEPTCECGASITPATVLDPFSGSATTGEVALRLGRNYVGLDLNPDYLELAVARLEGRRPPQPESEPSPEDVSILDLFGSD